MKKYRVLKTNSEQRILKYSIKKLNIGVASVLIGTSIVFGGATATYADVSQPGIESRATDISSWKPDNLEDGTDSVNISASGYDPISSIGWKGWVASPVYTEDKDGTFGWSSKPGGNNNYADELIRVKGNFNADKSSIHWVVTIKGDGAGLYKGVMRDFYRPYFLISTSRGLGKPENWKVTSADGTVRRYPSNFDDMDTSTRNIYGPKPVDVHLNDGAILSTNLLGGDTYPMTEWGGGYRLGVTGADETSSMNYNIEKYLYYSKYMLEDWIQSGTIQGDETRIYEFDTPIVAHEVLGLGSNVPNVNSQFTNWMGWGDQRNDVDLGNKVWITV